MNFVFYLAKQKRISTHQQKEWREMKVTNCVVNLTELAISSSREIEYAASANKWNNNLIESIVSYRII